MTNIIKKKETRKKIHENENENENRYRFRIKMGEKYYNDLLTGTFLLRKVGQNYR